MHFFHLTRTTMPNSRDKRLQRKYKRRPLLAPQLEQGAYYRSRRDISDWLAALEWARSPHYQYWKPLIDLYTDVEMDAHLSSLLQTRRLRVLREPFTLRNEAGDDVSVLLRHRWFDTFVRAVVDSIFYGYTMIEVLAHPEAREVSVTLLPRAHYAPLRGGILARDVDPGSLLPVVGTELETQVICLGEWRDLGLLAQAAPLVLRKKNAVGAWSEFTEVFGMPIRIGKTASGDQREINRMEEFLEKMGSRAYAVIDSEDDIMMRETARSDAYRVYNELCKLMDAQLSKLIVGQTMTTDDGSSRSQAEVHERIFDDITAYDKQYVAMAVNDYLIPLLQHEGEWPTGLTFGYDERVELSQLDLDSDQMLLDRFELDDLDYFRERYGVPITGLKGAQAQPQQPDDPEPPQPGDTTEQLSHDQWVAEIDRLYQHTCHTC